MYYKLQLMGPSAKSMHIFWGLLSDSVSTGFTESVYSQYYVNL